MLKKLVKYGNSNALVLDKPILELLRLEEGAVVRLEIEGKALIITPHAPTVATAETVHAPLDQHETYLRAMIEKGAQQYTHLTEAERIQFVTESLQNYRELSQASAEFTRNPELYQQYQTALTELLKTKPAVTTAEKVALLQQYSPAMQAAQQKALALNVKYKLPGLENGAIDSAKYRTMQEEFSQLFATKNNPATSSYCANLAEVLNHPDYLHELQLLAESYKAGALTTAQYTEASQEIMYKYLPEMREIHTKMAEIGAKFNLKSN